MKKTSKNNLIFGGLKSQDINKARVIVIPVPFDMTTSYMKGTEKGPEAILSASAQIDEIWGEKVLSRIDKEQLVFTTEEIRVSGTPENALNKLAELLKKIPRKNQIPFVLGGEHTITYSCIKAIKDKFDNLSVLQFDAHPDLREEYKGEKFSHACAMKLVEDLGVPVTSVGIRSVDCDVKEEVERRSGKNLFLAPGIPTEKILNNLSNNVYLTFDVDALDPSIMLATGTPVPGGLYWYETLEFLEKLIKTKNIVGLDMVELCPIHGHVAPDFLAAKLSYKIIEFLTRSHSGVV